MSRDLEQERLTKLRQAINPAHVLGLVQAALAAGGAVREFGQSLSNPVFDASPQRPFKRLSQRQHRKRAAARRQGRSGKRRKA